MEHQMDTVYLKEQVGAPLSFAMAAMAIKKPSDPVDFIGRWLLKYVENQTKDEVIQNQIEQRVADAIAALKKKEEEEVKAQEKALAAQKAAEPKKLEDTDTQNLNAALDAAHEHQALFMAVLALIKDKTKANSAYLALSEEHDDAVQLKYICAVPESANKVMRGKVCGRQRIPVTFRALQERRIPKAATGEPGADGQPALPASPPKSPTKGDISEDDDDTGSVSSHNSDDSETSETPSHRGKKKKHEEEDEISGDYDVERGRTVHVEDVFKEKAIYYFGIPKPGAYLCVPIRDQANSAIKGIVGLDTLGQNRAFTKEEIQIVEFVSSQIAAHSDRINREIEAKIQAENAALLAKYEANRDNKEKLIEMEIAEMISSGIEYTLEEQRTQEVAVKRLHQVGQELTVLVETEKTKIEELCNAKSVPDAVFNVVRAIFTLINHPQLENIKYWAHAKAFITEDLITALVNFKNEDKAKKTREKYAAIDKLLEELDETAIKSTSFVAFLLWEWLRNALNVRTAEANTEKARKAAEDAAKEPGTEGTEGEKAKADDEEGDDKKNEKGSEQGSDGETSETEDTAADEEDD
eukprot:gnl/Hemi2/20922_TR6932_c0_g2_i1.p1 gnl/Hemi2/20922_TR6932_c0_g2~~gnl/Hemi2/20922_TR6932_c0_g2_i1.p1  ORF type:complete len:582 (-),score=222.34 gnl/Hemi2/20922_TR6932_c0_g2_i1:96-1841(-)